MNFAGLRRRAAFGLWTEKLARAVAPGCFILLAYLASALFGFGAPWIFTAALLLAGAAFAFGIAGLQRPGPEEIDRRIEQASGLAHRPIAALEDAPENDTPMAGAIWRLHQRRLALSLQTARTGGPRLDAALRDPYALRGLLVLLLLTGAVIAGPAAPQRLAGAFSLPSWPLSGPGVNAWITLPPYTGAPPLVLVPGVNPVVPTGSRLTVVVNGESRRPAAVLGHGEIRLDPLGRDSFRVDAKLRGSAILRIGPWWHRLASWNITVVPPAAPVVQLSQVLPVDHFLLMAWRAQDRYGLTALAATLLPVGHPDARPEMHFLPLDSPNAKTAAGTAKPDIGDSPYAGLRVTVTLAARNLAGVTGTAPPMIVQLPPAELHDKTALALAALRQRLALQPGDTKNTGDALQKLAEAPPSHIAGATDLQMAVLARQIGAGEIPEDAAQKLMAQLARQIEQGPDYAPAQALAAANAALTQALRQAMASGQPLDNARLQALLAAMHAALAQHLQALRQTMGQAASAPDNRTIDTGDLDQLAEQIARDEAAGQTARAQAELNRLQQMLASLQSAKPMTAEQARRAQAADKAAQDLSQLTQRQASLLDQTNLGKATPDAQGALQQQLSQTQQSLGKSGIALPGLGDAATAMSAARRALSKDDITGAADAEASAIQALQQAAAALAASAQGMAFGTGAEPGMGEEGGSDGLNGAPDENAIPGILPSGDDPAGAIQRQIIKNDEAPELPSAVHQYYDRLLDQGTP